MYISTDYDNWRNWFGNMAINFIDLTPTITSTIIYILIIIIPLSAYIKTP